MSDSQYSEPKTVLIMRGIQGSGKSTMAKLLCRPFGLNGKIHSTDSYFYDEQMNYRFNPTKLPEYRAKNLAAFEKSLKGGLEMVICDNVNARHAYYAEYVALAKKYGYRVAIVTMPHPTTDEAVGRNKHGVPHEAIERILKIWEA